MAGLIPIPNTRVSNLLVRDRLLAQLQGDQLDIFRLENQVSTGRRISLPSEDAPAAQRAIALQRLVERKTQLASNVEAGNSFLAATDSALGDVATQLGDIRGSALGVAGTTNTQAERNVVVDEVQRAIDQLVQTGNQQFRGRFLFAGSETNVKPYSFVNGFVQYAGDDKAVNNFSDIGVLFSTNASGVEVFGGVSSQVLGGVNLDPQVTSDTLLSSLRGGRGISPDGALSISDGTHSTVVDVSKAATVGDVARLIEANPPAGRSISATITGKGLTLQLDAAGGGNLTVNEVASGKAASELGILEKTGVLTSPLVGDDLDPVILKTTPVTDLLGAKAGARLISSGNNNDLLIKAAANGSQFNGAAVQIVDDDLLTAAPGVAQGSEFAQYDTSARAAQASLKFSGADNDLIVTANTSGVASNNVKIFVNGATGLGDAANAVYDASTKRLTITVDDAGATSVQRVVDAINAEGTFTAAHDVSVDATYNPAALILASDVSNVTGDTGNSGGAAKTLYVHIAAGLSTANDIVAAINAEGTFTAGIDPHDTRILAQAGTQPVDVDATAATTGGSGATLDLASGVKITNGGQSYTLDFSQAKSVEDVLNVFNESGASVLAEINTDGTGVNVRSRLSGGDFQIGENGGQTATQLGIRSLTGTTQLASLNYGIGVPTNDGRNLTINSSNLQLGTRDGQTFNVDLSAAATVTDVINAISAATGPNVAVSASGGGIQLVDQTIGPAQLNVTQTGAALGISGGVATTIPTSDFSITPKSGAGFNVDLSGAQTLQDSIDAINAASGGKVTAQLATVGNGIELIDNTVGVGQLTVQEAEGSQAAEYLGLVPIGTKTATGAGGTITGSDQNFVETSSVFNSLVRLRDALQAGDIPAINQAIGKIDGDIDRVSSARGDVGARQQALGLSTQHLQDEDVQLRSALSDDIDVDLVQAISDLTARQTSFQASLQSMASILKLSLLDFI